ncbi:unnamed protein product [Nezara viridula]|uniref:Uncharacterized protein n=1 Tax=Nezara viridula TaxID=85310 RepID=A0A9P0H268_NEZVI|nr:unnamed protein product [Nezara viridula]
MAVILKDLQLGFSGRKDTIVIRSDSLYVLRCTNNPKSAKPLFIEICSNFEQNGLRRIKPLRDLLSLGVSRKLNRLARITMSDTRCRMKESSKEIQRQPNKVVAAVPEKVKNRQNIKENVVDISDQATQNQVNQPLYFQQMSRSNINTELTDRQKAVVDAFNYAWRGYKNWAWGHDSLRTI